MVEKPEDTPKTETPEDIGEDGNKQKMVLDEETGQMVTQK